MPAQPRPNRGSVASHPKKHGRALAHGSNSDFTLGAAELRRSEVSVRFTWAKEERRVNW